MGLTTALFLVLNGSLLTENAASQIKEQAPSDLIRFLTYQSDRSGKRAALAGATGCGHIIEDRAAAKSLASLGVSAIPDPEEALDSIEKQGQLSEFGFNSAWLLYAYAKIEGRPAFPRLRRMIHDPKLEYLQLDLGDAIALSLDLTSYVPGSRQLHEITNCSRLGEPRDALNQLILAWERNDRRWFQASLGPAGRAALSSLLRGRSWTGMRAELWRVKSRVGVAVGYRFDG